MDSFQTREAAEQAALQRAPRDTHPLYVCKDNNGKWLITTHPEYFKDAYRIRSLAKTEESI